MPFSRALSIGLLVVTALCVLTVVPPFREAVEPAAGLTWPYRLAGLACVGLLLGLVWKVTDGRRLAAILAISLLATTGITLEEFRQDSRVYFRLDMTSNVSGYAQLFFDQGQGFNEGASRNETLYRSNTPITYNFRLPPGSIKQFRFDPNASPGQYSIGAPKLVRADGREIAAIPLSSFTAEQQIEQLALEHDRLRFVVPPGSNDPTLRVSFGAVVSPWYALWREIGVEGDFFLYVSLLSLAVLALLSLIDPRLIASALARRQRVFRWASGSPRAAIFLVAVASVACSNYPVVFLGKSFVSPNNGGAAQLYLTPPFLPGAADRTIEDTRASDVGATMWEYRPYSAVQYDSISQLELPMWNRFSNAGTPLLAQGVSMIGDPLHWIAVAGRGAAWAWDLKFILAKIVFCASVGGLVFLTSRSLRSALILTASSAFLGFFIFRLNHPAFFAVCYAPMILLAWAGMLQSASFRQMRPYGALLFLAMLMELNSGTAKEAYMLVIFLNATGAIALLLQRASLREKVLKAAIIGLTGVASIMILSPFWLTFQDEIGRSYNLSTNPAVQVFPPYLFIGFFDEIYYALAQPNRLVVGPAVNLLIAACILWAIAGAHRLLREAWFVAALVGGLFSAAMAFGMVSPALLAKIPIIRNVAHIGNTFSCVLLVQSIVVAGFGLREFFSRVREENLAGDSIRWGVLVLALGWFYLSSMRGSIVWDAFGLIFAVVPLIALVIAAFVTPSLFSKVAAPRPVIIVLLCMVAVHARLGQHPTLGAQELNLYVANPHSRPDFLAPSPVLQALPNPTTSPYRVVGVDGVMFPGYQASIGVESIYGADALAPLYLRELIDAFKFTHMFDWATIVRQVDVPSVARALDAFNVRFLLYPPDAESIADGSVVARKDLVVVERQSAWPRAFFTDKLSQYSSPDELADRIRSANQPIAAVQSGEDGAPQPLTGAGIVVPATNYVMSPNGIRFTVDAPGGGVVVVGQAFLDRSFIARLNDEAASVFRVNHAFVGVRVPAAGHYTISLAYRPPLLTLALILSAVGFILLVGLWVFGGKVMRQSAVGG